MQSIEIEPTYKSPHVVFNAAEKKLKIEGKSILVKVEEFYRPLLNWVDSYINEEDPDSIEFTFDIEYFNLASTKRFLFFLLKLREHQERGKKVIINWTYASNDRYVFEMGQDLSQMLKMTFNFVGYERLKSKEFLAN